MSSNNVRFRHKDFPNLRFRQNNSQNLRFRQWLKNGTIHYWGIVTRSDGVDAFIMPCNETDVDPKDCLHQMCINRMDVNGEWLYDGDFIDIDGDIYQINIEYGQPVYTVGDDVLVKIAENKFTFSNVHQVNINNWRI